MGYFTWKFADDRRKKLQYGGKGYIAMPDGTFIEETCYDGYGIFGTHDAYDVVVDLNKPYLKDIYTKIENKYGDRYILNEGLRKVVDAYADDDTEALEKAVNKIAETKPYFKEDWKRTIGIAISCYDDDNAALPYPLKIVSSDKLGIPYEKLKISTSTQ